MKRFIFVLMIFVLIFSVFTMNSMLVFAEGEGEETTGTEETVPEGDTSTEEGTEETAPEGDTSTEEGTEETLPETDEKAPEPGSEEEIQGLFAELVKVLGDIKNDFVEIVQGIVNFISDNETYKSIAGIVLAVLGALFIPILVAVLAIAYIAIAAIVIVSTALVSLLELLIGLIPGIAFII